MSEVVAEADAVSPELQEAYEGAIRACVRDFYDKAKADDLLGPVFNGWIRDWDRHLSTMDDFWSGALTGTKRYNAAPFPPHLKLEMTQAHFDRWRDLWIPAAERNLPDPLKARAVSMGEHMSHCWGRAYQAMTQEKAEA
jgi:hemoglobin